MMSGGGGAQANVAPDAGSLLRDIERNQSQAIPKAIPKPEVKKEISVVNEPIKKDNLKDDYKVYDF